MSSRKQRRQERDARSRERSGDTPDKPSGSSSFRQVAVAPAPLPKAKKVDHVTASLAAIYGEAPAEAKDLLKTMEQARRRTWLAVGIGFAVFLAFVTAAAWVGYWWWGNRGFTGGGIQLVIEGPARVSLGQETTYFINWFNRSKEPLAATEIRVSFPNDFVVTSVDPKPAAPPLARGGVVFRLGSQAVDARGTLKVTGTFTGALGTKSAVQVIATYRPASFNSQFEELATQEIEYADTVLEGELSAPAKALPGDKIMLAYSLRNKGTEPMKDLLARVRLPEGFVRESSPSAATGTGDLPDDRLVTLPLGTIEAGASSTVRLAGTFALGSHGDAVFQAEAGRLTSEGAFAAAERTEATVSVLAGDLNVKLVVNGSDQNRSVSRGERQRIAISYENTSGEELRDIILRFHLGADPPLSPLPRATSSVDLIDWRELDDPAAGRRDHDTLIYLADQIGQLERLPPNANGLIELTVPVMDQMPASRDVPILAWVEATVGAVDKVKVNRTVKTQPIALRLQTDAALSAVARYASEEGAQLGRGPLPPSVGTTTVYRVEWRIAKTLHALDRVTVSATLPKNVSFGGVKEVGAGEVGYDPDRRLISWTVNKIPENVNELLVSFDAGLTPFESDAGRFAQLLGESRLEFTDAAIGEPVLRTAPSLTTDLPDDDLAKNKGVVRVR